MDSKLASESSSLEKVLNEAESERNKAEDVLRALKEELKRVEDEKQLVAQLHSQLGAKVLDHLLLEL